MTLTEFLLARIAEDEAACLTDTYFGPPTMDDSPPQRMDFDEMFVGPRRWLAECEAKRRIVAEFQRNAHLVDTAPEVLATEVRRTNLTLEGVLLHHAAVYADHPDYRAEWRP